MEYANWWKILNFHTCLLCISKINFINQKNLLNGFAYAYRQMHITKYNKPKINSGDVLSPFNTASNNVHWIEIKALKHIVQISYRKHYLLISKLLIFAKV